MTDNMAPQNIIKREVKRLRDILENGLHEIYEGSFETFLFDFYTDFSWIESKSVQQFKALIANDEWCTLAAAVKEKHGFDFLAAAEEWHAG